MKKKWCKPELIVLVRNQPQEAVLEICKVFGGAITGPYTDPETGEKTKWDKCNQGPVTAGVHCVDTAKT